MSRLILIASVPVCHYQQRGPGAMVIWRKQLDREIVDFSGLHLTARRSFHVTSALHSPALSLALFAFACPVCCLQTILFVQPCKYGIHTVNEMPLTHVGNGYVVCGVCHCDSDSYPKKTYYCPACIGFKLLKYNLNKINLQNVNSLAAHDINSVLKACFGDNATQFLTKYTDDYDKNDRDKKLDGTNVSIGSVARLAFMLMNVDLLKKQEHIKSIEQLVEGKRRQSEKLEGRIKLLHEKRKGKQRLLDLHRERMAARMATELQNITEIKRLLNIGIVTRQNEYISLEQRKGTYDLMVLWNVRILDEMKITVLFSPILAMTQLASHSMDLVLSSLMKSCELVEAFARMLDTELPFRVDTGYNDFAIGDFYYKLKDKRSIFEMNHVQMLKFCMGIARVISNVVVLLRRVDATYQFESITLADLLAYDALLVRLVTTLLGKDGAAEVQRRTQILENKIFHPSAESRHSSKGKHISPWRFCFSSYTDETQTQTPDVPPQTSVARYNVDTVKEYNSVLSSSAITGRIPDEMAERSLTGTVRASNPAIDATELVHDERRLAEEVFCFLAAQMQGLRHESSSRHPLAQKHLRKPKAMKHESQMWVLT